MSNLTKYKAFKKKHHYSGHHEGSHYMRSGKYFALVAHHKVKRKQFFVIEVDVWGRRFRKATVEEKEEALRELKRPILDYCGKEKLNCKLRRFHVTATVKRKPKRKQKKVGQRKNKRKAKAKRR